MTFSPELGQYAFSNTPWQRYKTPYYVESGLHELGDLIAPDNSPTGNYGPTRYDFNSFSIGGYCWCDGDGPGHEDGCPPNFEYRPSGFTVCWYKHAGRSSYMNRPMDSREWASILVSCISEVLA